MKPRSERPHLRTTFDSILSNYFQVEEMPTHCCVPECTKKGYRKDDGTKVSYFKFPTENQMKKKWLHAIRRDEGKHFKVTEYTNIYSRHFREGDIKKSLAGKNELRDGVVPSVFPWIRTSPRKRKEPAERNFELTASKSAFIPQLLLLKNYQTNYQTNHQTNLQTKFSHIYQIVA